MVRMKKIVLICLALAVLLFFSFGCTQTKDDGAVMLEFTKLKQEYGVQDAYSPDADIMNNYINALSELRVQSSVFVSFLNFIISYPNNTI